ncbi:MAG: DMT family transporter [Chitinophagales bacterium]
MSRDSIINWSLLILLGVIWGFSFFFIKRGLVVFDSNQVGALRIFIAFLSLLPIVPFIGFKIPKGKLPLVFLSAMLGSAIPPFLFALAQTKISSSVTGILNSLTPLFALLAGVTIFKLTMKWNHLIGVLVGLGGAILVVLIQSDGSFDFNFGYSLLIILATLFYGINANIIKSKLYKIHPVKLGLLNFCLIGPIAGIYLFSTDFVEVMQTNNQAWESLIYLCILGSVGTAYALIVFNYLAVRTSALFATMVTYIIPVVSVIIGFFDGESLGMIHIIGLTLILFGVYISSLGRKKTKS